MSPQSAVDVCVSLVPASVKAPLTVTSCPGHDRAGGRRERVQHRRLVVDRDVRRRDTTGGFTPSLTLSWAPTTRSSLQFTVGVSVVIPV